MALTVPIYRPQLSVVLYKTIRRQHIAGGTPVSARFTGIDQEIDLTKFLGEGGSVTTSKSLRDPAGGFNITLCDKAFEQRSGGFESLYGLLEPMDVIEIRMRHGAGSGAMPVVMRGFLTTVTRSETMGSDGRPMRQVLLSGQDYGKIWQQLRIIHQAGYILGQDTLSNFKLFARFGVGFSTSMKAGDFVKEFVGKILNPYLKALLPKSSAAPAEVKVDPDGLVSHGTTSLAAAQNQEGALYDIMVAHLDVGIWNELFIEDRDDGVYLVFRPNPYRTTTGRRIQEDAPNVDLVHIGAQDIISLSVSRTDANVANYFWVRGPRFEMVSDARLKQAALPDKETVLLEDYPNAAATLYGVRPMEAATQMGGDDTSTFLSGQDAAANQQRDTGISNWLNDRRRIMVEQNKDNVVFETGALRVRGDERLRPGRYVRVQRGSFTADYYIVQVQHDFAPIGGNFITTLQVERGTGFIERSQRGGAADSPYFSELRSSQ